MAEAYYTVQIRVSCIELRTVA